MQTDSCPQETVSVWNRRLGGVRPSRAGMWLVLAVAFTCWLPSATLGTPPAATASRRLLFDASMRPGAGLVVQAIEPESPVRSMPLADNPRVRVMLEPGDIVSHVDGRRIDSLATYFRLLADGGETVTLTVVNSRTGRSFDAVARPVGGRVRVPPNRPPPRPPTGVVRVLLVGDTNDEKNGGHFATSLRLVRSLLENFVSRMDIEVVDDDSCKAATIISRVEELGRRAGPEDSLFVWVDAHGAYDPKLAAGDPSGGHYFAIPGLSLPRKLLFDTLLAQPGKLKVLLSSSCNHEGVARPARDMVVEQRTMTIRGPTNLERLLHYHRGYLDINQAKRDQYGWSDSVAGSYICEWFRRLAPQHATWNNLIPELAAEVDAEYRRDRAYRLEHGPGKMRQHDFEAMKNQEHLNPVVFQQRLNAEPVPAGGELREITTDVYVPTAR